MMVKLKVLSGLINLFYFFCFNNINDSILIDNDRMIFKRYVVWPNRTDPFSRNNRADMLDLGICHQL